MTLQKKHKLAAAVKPLATRPEDARLEAAAAPAGAVQSAPAPVQAPAAQPSFEPAGPLKVLSAAGALSPIPNCSPVRPVSLYTRGEAR